MNKHARLQRFIYSKNTNNFSAPLMSLLLQETQLPWKCVQ